MPAFVVFLINLQQKAVINGIRQHVLLHVLARSLTVAALYLLLPQSRDRTQSAEAQDATKRGIIPQQGAG
jgi:membrane-bound metal-dependent hydrolase YbcI (DUF457 family)